MPTTSKCDCDSCRNCLHNWLKRVRGRRYQCQQCGMKLTGKPTPSPAKAQAPSESQQDVAQEGLSPIMGLRLTTATKA